MTHLRSTDRSAIAILIAVGLASFTLLPLTRDTSYIPLALALVLIEVVVAAVMRRLGINNGIVLGVQLAVLAVYLGSIALALGGSQGSYWHRVVELYVSATEHMRVQAAPMDPHPGVKLLFVTAIGVVAILTDVLVVGIDRPAWAIAPTLTLYLVPALGLVEDVTWWPFVCIAAGYLIILLSEGIGLAERWPRSISSGTNDQGWVGPFAARTAALIGIPVIIVAVLLGTVVPLPGQPGWGFSRARGNSGPLQMADPTLDLKRNLTQPDDATVLTYRTDKPTGTYLRMASLPVFNSDGWQNTGVSLRDSRTLTPIPGYTGDTTNIRRTDISIGDFRTEYLPAPYAPRSFTADGQWAFDPNSLVILGTGSNRADATRNLTYSVDSVDIEPSGAALSGAEAGTPVDANLTSALPADVPPEIIDLTMRITRNAPTPALKAAAIQAYLRSDTFIYSTDPQPGNGYDALTNFLLRDHKGYCEQFASAMALMARIVGIPTRVSVGFLPGERSGDHWEVTIRDMHAWPELYFEGEGWVRFEPTPAIVTGNAPPWTVERGSDSGEESTNPSSSPTSATEQPTGEATPTPTATPTPSEAPAPSGTGFPWGRVLAGLGIIAALLVLGAIPGLLRRRLRSQRLAEVDDPVEQVENAWDEIRDSVVDNGDPWPDGSPRAIGAEVGARLEPAPARAMSALAQRIEQARFARSYTGDASIVSLAREVLDGVEADRSWDVRFASNWWPRSFWQSLAARLPWRR